MSLKQLIATAFIICLITVFSSCKKEEITESFVRGGNALIQTNDGNILVAGYNVSSSNGFEAALVLTNQLGVVTWSKMYGGYFSDALFSVKNARDGGYIASGFSNTNMASSPRLLVLRTDASGDQQWAYANYSNNSFSQGFCIIPHADSGYLVTGYIQTSGSADRDIYLLRINENGEKLWDKRYIFTSSAPYDSIYEEAYSIIAAPDSGYFLTGSMHGYSNCCGKIFLMKVSETGDSLWTKIYNPGAGFSLLITNDGNIAIGGTSYGSTSDDMTIIKTDLEGNKIWSKIYGGTGYEYGSMMVTTTDDGYAITGITESKGAGSQDVYLVRTNASGDMIWDKTYGGGDIDEGLGLIQMSDGGFCITGISNSDGSSIFLNRTSADGIQQWYSPIK